MNLRTNLKKYCLLYGILGSNLCLSNTEYPLPFTLDIEPLATNERYRFEALITLKNNSNRELKNWQLHFSQPKPITKVTGAILQKKQPSNGYHYTLLGYRKSKILKAKSSQTIHIWGISHLKNKTDMPAGIYLTAKNIPEPIALTINARNFKKNPIKRRLPSPIPTPVNVTPYPNQVKISSGDNFLLTKQTNIYLPEGMQKPQAVSQLYKKLATQLTIKTWHGKLPHEGIIFSPQAELAKESYKLSINHSRILIEASSKQGFLLAVSTLNQLLPIDAKTVIRHKSLAVKPMTINDAPQFSYRGIHLDVSRHFFKTKEVKRLITLAAMFKINKFHWHLTDDEGWRVEIKRYPELTAIGSIRGPGYPLPPAYGSGHKVYGGYYTHNDIRSIVLHAKSLGIEVIPEVEMIGHARALVKSLPHLLIDTEDRSKYKSIQQYTDNILTPCLESTFQVLENIISELSPLFESRYFHIGGDEVPEGVWDPTRSPKCAKLMQARELKTRQDLQAYFTQRINTILEQNGKVIAGWEELANKGLKTSLSPILYKWNPYHKDQLCDKDWQIVNATANALYFDQAYYDTFDEPGFYWAGYINTKTVYDFNPTQNQCPGGSSNLIGIQGNIFTEYIHNQERLDYMVFPRLLALAELAWTKPENRSWQRFTSILETSQLPKLAEKGIKYRRL